VRGNATLNIRGTIGNEFTDVNTTKDYEALKQAIKFHVTKHQIGSLSANQTIGPESSKLEVETDLICYNRENGSSARAAVLL
jgi:hypothetical protein